MRIDKFLKVSRIIKRRTVANEACDASRITVNGRPVKASYDVKVGDVITVSFGQRELTVRVANVRSRLMPHACTRSLNRIHTTTDLPRSPVMPHTEMPYAG